MKIAVTAFPRTLQGTSASRRLRATGRVPGIIYGADKAAQAVEVDHAALLRHLKLEAFHASILDMTVEGVIFRCTRSSRRCCTSISRESTRTRKYT